MTDDGVGGADPGGGSGLHGLRDRIDALDGSIEVSSTPGRGATISVRIPISRAEAAGALTGPQRAVTMCAA